MAKIIASAVMKCFMTLILLCFCSSTRKVIFSLTIIQYLQEYTLLLWKDKTVLESYCCIQGIGHAGHALFPLLAAWAPTGVNKERLITQSFFVFIVESYANKFATTLQQKQKVS